jgi:asparaginyl-tRNA synthetase
MSEFISIQKAMEQGSGEVAIRGWVWRERGSSKIKFIVLRDSTNVIQCVLKNDNFSDRWEEIDRIQLETSIEIKGEIKKDERAPSGYELLVSDYKVIGWSDTYPITKDQSTEFLLDKRHLWIRSRKLTAIMKVRSTVFWAIHKFYRDKAFHEMPPPIFTPNQCEGGSTLFEVKYYNDKMYLTQSWQLYAEAAIFSLENVYCISPTFRAEKSKTSRHLSEFWMAEVECAWYDLEKITELSKEIVAFIVQEVIKENSPELELLEQDVEKLKKIQLPFETITYTEALNKLKENGVDVEWGKDLRTIEEDELMKHYDKPIVVIEYPKEVMSFYKPEKQMRPGGEKDNAPGPVALCFDMLAPGGFGEIVGGSERDTDLESLKKSLEKEGEDISNYEWYLDLRKYGSVPHAGFGLGVERIVAWLCNLDNIKDAIPFPRTMLRSFP